MTNPADDFSCPCGICILGGGLSSRMGRDKARLRLGRRTMIGQIRATALGLGLPVRVLRRDIVPGCGPLGGIYTALTTSAHPAELFLACDMPLVSRELLERMLSALPRMKAALFAAAGGHAGFPCLLRRNSLPLVHQQIERKEFSLQALVRVLRAGLIPPIHANELFNVNTPANWKAVRILWKQNR